MVRHLRKPGHPRRRRLVSYRPPVRSITPRQPPGRSASLPLSFLSLSLHFALLPPLNFLSFPLRFLFRFLPIFFLQFPRSTFFPPPSTISPTAIPSRVFRSLSSRVFHRRGFPLSFCSFALLFLV